MLDTSGDEWASLTAEPRDLTPHREVGPDDTFVMIFTSGTSGDPKAVQVQHMMPIFAGTSLAQRYSVSTSDVCYVSMPLFHSNSIYAGWGVAMVTGAAIVPAVFTVSRFLDDIRRYGVTFMNYVGKPLAYILSTPEKPDDHDNPLRVAFGNEASDRDIAEFARRFDCTVWDGFGSTENAVIITREDGCPEGSLGKGFPGVAIYDPETVQECEVAAFDDSGDLVNREAAVGELVNTSGGGLFRGYYKDAGRNGSPVAPRHVLVGGSGLPRRRRLDLLRGPHGRLDAGRRRKPRRRTDRANPDSASRGQPRCGVPGSR